jgi:hypothetical protein
MVILLRRSAANDFRKTKNRSTMLGLSGSTTGQRLD